MFAVHQEAAAQVIRAPRELDLLNAGALESLINLSSASHDYDIILSLAGCNYCDSSALSVFVRSQKSFPSRFALVVPPENVLVHRLLAISGLRGLLKVYPSVSVALGSATA